MNLQASSATLGMLKWGIISVILKIKKGNGSNSMTVASIHSIQQTSKLSVLVDHIHTRMNMIGRRDKTVKAHIF